MEIIKITRITKITGSKKKILHYRNPLLIIYLLHKINIFDHLINPTMPGANLYCLAIIANHCGIPHFTVSDPRHFSFFLALQVVFFLYIIAL